MKITNNLRSKKLDNNLNYKSILKDFRVNFLNILEKENISINNELLNDIVNNFYNNNLKKIEKDEPKLKLDSIINNYIYRFIDNYFENNYLISNIQPFEKNIKNFKNIISIFNTNGKKINLKYYELSGMNSNGFSYLLNLHNESRFFLPNDNLLEKISFQGSFPINNPYDYKQDTKIINEIFELDQKVIHINEILSDIELDDFINDNNLSFIHINTYNQIIGSSELLDKFKVYLHEKGLIVNNYIEDFNTDLKCIDNNLFFLHGDNFCSYDNKDNKNMLNFLLNLKVLEQLDKSLFNYIQSNHFIKYLENSFSQLFDENFLGKKIIFNFTDIFNDKISQLNQSLIIFLFLNNFFKKDFINDFFDNLINLKDGENFDLYDLLILIFEKNNIHYSKNNLKSLFNSGFTIKKFKETNIDFYNFLQTNFLEGNIFSETHNSFFIDIDIKKFLKDNNNFIRNICSYTNYSLNLSEDFSKDYVNNILDIGNKYKNKYEYIFKDMIFDKFNNNHFLEDEKKDLINYLSNKDIYEFEDEVYFEFDGIDEFLTMGIAPQPSCQNLLVDTGLNHKLLSNITIPYTKLILGFNKPKGYKGIDFNTKEIIFNKDGIETREKLYVKTRNLLVIGDLERSKGVLLQKTYGKSFNIENIKKVEQVLEKKYINLGKKISKKFYNDKNNTYEYDLWFYEENGDKK